MRYCSPIRCRLFHPCLVISCLLLPASQAQPVLLPKKTIAKIIDRVVADTPFILVEKKAPFYRENIYRYNVDKRRGQPTLMVSYIQLAPDAKENHQDSRDQLQLSISHDPGSLQVLHNGQIRLKSRSDAVQPIKNIDYQLNQFALNLPIQVEQDDKLTLVFTPHDDKSNVYLSFTYPNSGMASNKVKLIAPYGQGHAHYLLQGASGASNLSYSSPNSKAEFDVPEPLDFSDWRYFTGTLVDAIHQANNQFDNFGYDDFVRQHTKFFLDNVDKVTAKRKQNGIQGGVFSHYERFALLDDFAPQIVPLLNLKQSNDVVYEDYDSDIDNLIERALIQISDSVPRLKDDTLTRVTPFRLTVQSDDLFMAGFPLVRAGLVLKQPKLIDDALTQAFNFHQYLHDPNTGFYRHAYFSNTQQQSASNWGRGVGWMAMTYTELLSVLPEAHPKRQSLLDIFTSFCDAMLDNQHVSGRWHQILNDPASYLETSVTAMFVRALAEGVVNGWLVDEKYRQAALLGWGGIEAQVDENGRVAGIVKGTPIFESDLAYIEQKTRLNDPRGLGAVIYAGVAIDKLMAE